MSQTGKNSSLYIDTTGLTLRETGKLKDGQSYDIVLLAPEHAAISHKLHHIIIENLEDEERTFILDKPLSYFAAHLGLQGAGDIIGIVVDGRLAAQAVIHNPAPEKPDTGMVDMELPGPPEQLSILQAVSVHPAFRGHSLMNRLVSHWVFAAHAAGRTYLVSEIETGNIASWKSFLTGGLNIVSLGHDPEDGTPVYNACEKTELAVKRQLAQEFNRAAKAPGTACPLKNLEEQKHLFSEGYKAVGVDKERKALVFSKLDL